MPSFPGSTTRISEYYERKSVLVTGGMGFIGSHLACALVDLGAKVTVLDVRTDSAIESLINDPVLGFRRRVRLISADLSDRRDVASAFGECSFDIVFNCAASHSVIETAALQPFETIRGNTIGAVNLLECVRQLSCHTRIVQVSTDKVYGELDGRAYDEERTPLRGIGVYDASKLAADVFTRMYSAYGVWAVVLRMCNIFGPGDFSTVHRVIPRAMRCLYEAAEPKGPELYSGSGDHWRDYLYVDDCIRALLLVACVEECRGGCFNLGAGEHISTADLLRQVVEVAYEVEREHDERRADAIRAAGICIRPQTLLAGAVVLKRQHLDGSKLARVTGFTATVEFREGLARTIRGYRDFYARRKLLTRSCQ